MRWKARWWTLVSLACRAQRFARRRNSIGWQKLWFPQSWNSKSNNNQRIGIGSWGLRTNLLCSVDWCSSWVSRSLHGIIALAKGQWKLESTLIQPKLTPTQWSRKTMISQCHKMKITSQVNLRTQAHLNPMHLSYVSCSSMSRLLLSLKGTIVCLVVYIFYLFSGLYKICKTYWNECMKNQ